MRDDGAAERNRAVQFAPFDALQGYSSRLAALTVRTEERRILSEEAAETLSRRLASLCPGDTVKICYYSEKEHRYKTVYGEVREADFVFRRVTVGKNVISFDDIGNVKKAEP